MNDNTFLDDTSADNAETDQALRDAFGALSGAFATVDTADVISAATDSAAASGAPRLTLVSDPEVESQPADTEPPLHETTTGPRRHAMRWALVAAALVAAAIGGWAISRYRSDGPSVVRSVSPTEEGTGPSGGTVPPAILAEGNLVWVPEEWPEELANSPQTVGPGRDTGGDLERAVLVGPGGAYINIVKRPAPAANTTQPASASTVNASAVNVETRPGRVSGKWTKDGSLFEAYARTPPGSDGTSAESAEAIAATIRAVATRPWDSLLDASPFGGWKVLNEHPATVLSTLSGGHLGAVVIRSDSSWSAGITTLSVGDAPGALEELATALGLSLEPIDDISTLADPEVIEGRLATAWAPDDSHVAVVEVVASSPGEDQEPAADQERLAAEVARMIKSAHPTTLDKAGTWVDTRERNPGEFRNSGDETTIIQQGFFPDGNQFRVCEILDSDKLQVQYLLADDSQMGIDLLPPSSTVGGAPQQAIENFGEVDGMWTEIAQVAAAGKHDPAKIKFTVDGKTIPLGGYYDQSTDTTHAFGLVTKVPLDQRPTGPYKDVVVTLGD